MSSPPTEANPPDKPDSGLYSEKKKDSNAIPLSKTQKSLDFMKQMKYQAQQSASLKEFDDELPETSEAESAQEEIPNSVKVESGFHSIAEPSLKVHDWKETKLFVPEEHTKSLEVEFDLERVSLSINSFVQSFGRMIDSFVQAPSYLLFGSPSKLRASSNFTRYVESVGHYRPNLVSVEGDKITAWQPLKSKILDLKNVKHYSGVPSHERCRPEFFRVNLFNGLCVWIAKLAIRDWDQAVFVTVRNCRDFPHDVEGLMAGLDKSLIAPAVKAVKLKTEAELVDLALRFANQRKSEPELVFYRYPSHWVNDINTPRSVVLHLLRMQNIPKDLFPKIDGISDHQLIIAGLQLIAKDEDKETAKRAEWCLSKLLSAQEEDRQKISEGVRDRFDEMQNLQPNLSSLAFPWDCEEDEDNVDVQFEHEGTPYVSEARSYAKFSQAPEGLRPFLLNGSERLNSAIDYVSQQLGDDLVVKIVDIEVELPSSCPSIVTRSNRPAQGFSRRGHTWQEKLTLKLSYVGPWFFANTDIVDGLNNQIIAEVLSHGKTMRAVLMPRLVRYRTNTVKVPVYLDSFSFDSTGRARFGLLSKQDLDNSEEVLQSGVFRLVEKPIRNLILSYPNRTRIVNLRKYLWDGDVPLIELSDAKGSGTVQFSPQEGDHLECDPPDLAKDWLLKIRTATKTGQLMLNSVVADDELPHTEPDESHLELKIPSKSNSKSRGSSVKSANVKRELVVPKGGPEYKVGLWICKRFLSLPVTLRMYAASRAIDKLDELAHERDQTQGIRKVANSEGLSSQWAKELLTYVPRPRFSDSAGTKGDYYLVPSGLKLPTFLLEGQESSNQKDVFQEVPGIQPPSRDSRLVRYGRGEKPSIFYYE